MGNLKTDLSCRHCRTPLENQFVDLGYAPPSNAYLRASALNQPELYFPLRVYICDSCWLAQTEDFSAPEELFSEDYAYFSSISASWLAHAENYTSMIIERLALNGSSFVVELASNDGYLLKNFVAKNIPCLGVEPTLAAAGVSRDLGIETITEFFGVSLAQDICQSHRRADLIIGNNVFAHVPDIVDFASGIAELLNEDGVVTLEFPHLLELLRNNQFDTIYHEHYSYLSLTSITNIFASVGLRVFDVEQLTTHGGSLRIYGCLQNANRAAASAVADLLRLESSQGLCDLSTYQTFQSTVDAIKVELLDFLITAKKANKVVFAYGAAAKGNTLLNYAGVKPDLLAGVCDAAPSKQNKFLPGSHIPIFKPDQIQKVRPDYVLVFPWNILAEIQLKHEYIRDWGGQFVTAIPNLKIF